MQTYETDKYVELFNHSYQELLEICKTHNIYVKPARKYSKTEVIMMIAMDDTRAESALQRDCYRITACNETYWVKLTDQQVSFFHWLVDQDITPSNSDIEEACEIEYEEP